MGVEAKLKQEEAAVKKLQIAMQRNKLESEFEREKIARERREDKARIQILEDRIDELKRRRVDQEEYDSYRSPLSEARKSDSSASEIQRLHEEVNSLKEEIFTINAEAGEDKGRLEEAVISERQKVDELTEQLDTARRNCEKLPQLQKDLDYVSSQLSDAQTKLAEKEGTSATASTKTEERLMRQSAEKHASLKRELDLLKLENKLLNETADNTGLLQEKITDLTGKLSAAENELKTFRQDKETLTHVNR